MSKEQLLIELKTLCEEAAKNPDTLVISGILRVVRAAILSDNELGLMEVVLNFAQSERNRLTAHKN